MISAVRNSRICFLLVCKPQRLSSIPSNTMMLNSMAQSIKNGSLEVATGFVIFTEGWLVAPMIVGEKVLVAVATVLGCPNICTITEASLPLIVIVPTATPISVKLGLRRLSRCLGEFIHAVTSDEASVKPFPRFSPA